MVTMVLLRTLVKLLQSDTDLYMIGRDSSTLLTPRKQSPPDGFNLQYHYKKIRRWLSGILLYR
jgi:hypothetical protein